VPNLAPGSYRLLAFSGRQHQLAYRDAEVMQHFDGKGSVVTAAAGQEVHAEVPLLDDSFVGEN